MDIQGGPSSTYRLQFNSRFTFRDARDVVPYLHSLGVTHVYASPICMARKGSGHGYDAVDPTRLNPELGTESDFIALVDALKARDMGLILDIVPNHMAASLENPWWRDVLEHGPTSQYAAFFDIRWRDAGNTEASPLVLPVLGRPHADALAGGEISLGLDNGGFHILVYGRRMPVEAKAHRPILEQCLSMFSAGLNSQEKAALRRLVSRTGKLAPWQTTSPRGSAGRRKAARGIKDELLRLTGRSAAVKSAFQSATRLFNAGGGGQTEGGSLDRLLALQPYRLTYWRDGSRTLNYRRFFDVNDLAGVKVEDPAVFDATHSLVFELAAQGRISGVRVDHIDGLKDPAAYLRRLRRRLGPDFHISVEKILAYGEQLPEAWPVQGATGYEFMNQVNGLFVDPDGLEKLTGHYQETVASHESFDDVAYEKKKLAGRQLFPGDLNRLALALGRLSQEIDGPGGPPVEQFQMALLEVTACLPVYRTYIARGRRTREDLKWLNEALDAAAQRPSGAGRPAMEFLRRALVSGGQEMPGDAQGALTEFVAQWQQFTGPLAAKGVEDTALYVYAPLASVNEVGGGPSHGATSVASFHRLCRERQTRWPMSLSATATHDAKRGEDVRARLNSLSEVPGQWRRRFQRWTDFNRDKKVLVRGRPAPDPREEWLLYQNMLGAWPLNPDEAPGFKNRVKDYLVKAARESKLHTSWLEPDAEHEAALGEFADAILSGTGANDFLPDFLDFQRRVAFWGFLNSLSQTLLKLTAPGVPDTYQGTETWDFSLVDPDNRRTVDFEARKELLTRLQRQDSAGGDFLRGLAESWQDGRVKLFVAAKTLAFRREFKTLFHHGSYRAIETQGARAGNVCAFARRDSRDWSLTVAPRLVAQFIPGGTPPIGADVWSGTQLRLPKGAPSEWEDVFSGQRLRVTSRQRGLHLADLFQHLPVAVLHGQP